MASRFGGARKVCRAADVNGTGLEGHVIIRPLNRGNAAAAVPDGGSDVAVITAERTEPAQLELSCRTGTNGYQVISVTGELDINDDTFKMLKAKLDRRNTAAHPSNLIIMQPQADDMISDLVNNVILALV